MIVDANGKRDGLQIFVELEQQFVGRHGADESAFSWIHLWILCGFHGEMEKDFFATPMHSGGYSFCEGAGRKNRKRQLGIEF